MNAGLVVAALKESSNKTVWTGITPLISFRMIRLQTAVLAHVGFLPNFSQEAWDKAEDGALGDCFLLILLRSVRMQAQTLS